MRLIIAFLTICVALVAIIVSLLAGMLTTRTVTPAPPTPTSPPAHNNTTLSSPSQPPATHPSTQPPEITPDRPAPPPQTPDSDLPSTRPAPVTSSTIHWPDPQHDAQTQLRRAREALSANPDSILALRDEATALLALDRPHEAAESLGRLVKLRPDDIDLRFQHAAVLLRLRRWTAAIPALREVTSRDENHPEAWFNLAVAHQHLGHLHDARRAWNHAIAANPTTPAYARRGEVLLDLKQWQAAAHDFQAVLDADPDTADAALNLSLALWKLGRTDDARTPLLNLLEQHPRLLPAINRLAELAWHDYQLDPQANTLRRVETVEWCTRSLDIDPQQDNIRNLRQRALTTNSTIPDDR